MNPLKKGFRTLGLAIALGVIGVVDGFNWVNIIPNNVMPFVLPVIAALFGYLRTITTTAIGQSE